MKTTWLRSCLSLLCAFLLSVPVCAQRVASPADPGLDESRLTTLHGSVHPLARAEFDRGAVADELPLSRLLLNLARPADREKYLQQFLHDVHTTGSSVYRQWVTPEEFGIRFGADDEDTQLVSGWLESHGLSVARVSKSKSMIEFSGTAGQIREALHTEIHQYSVQGKTFYANASEISVPAAVASRIRGFAPLNSFPPASTLRLVGGGTMNRANHKVAPQFTITENSAPFYAFGPEDFATQYDVAPVYAAGINGAGQTIGVIGENNINLAMVDAYRKLFNLPADHTQIIIDGQDPGDGVGPIGIAAVGPFIGDSDNYPEIEVAGAIAPDATINFYIASGWGQNALALAALRAVEDNQASVLSFSYNECEQLLGEAGNQLWADLWEQAAAQGQTVLVSSGDGGPSACGSELVSSSGSILYLDTLNVNGFGSTPWNVTVGSTDFYYSDYASGAPSAATLWNQANDSSNGSLKGPLPEQPFSSFLGLNVATSEGSSGVTIDSIFDSFGRGASGGGASNCSQETLPSSGIVGTCISGYPKPSWQNAPGVPDDQARDLPDVSVFGGTGSNLSAVPICAQPGDCASVTSGNPQVTLVGGSSVSAPSMAGIVALIDQKYGRQGQANYTLYALARQFPAVFHDIALGTNDTTCALNTSPDCNTPISNNSFEESYGVYAAGPGYDLASGLGSVDVSQLLNNWNKITYAPSTTTLEATPASVVHGSAVTIDIVVKANSGSATPTGNVVLSAGEGTTIPENTPLALTNGSTSASVTNLPGGSYQLTANYSGDGTFAPSASAPVTLTITPEASTTTLKYGTSLSSGLVVGSSPASLPPGEVAYGSNAAFTATPSSQATNTTGLATGTVAFTDGSTTATVPLDSNGIATWRPANFDLGAHSVTAAYSGDASFQASTSAPLAITVVKGTPEFLVNPAISGDCIGSTTTGTTGPVCTYQAGDSMIVSVQLGGLVASGISRLLLAPNGSIAPPTGTVTVNLGSYAQTLTLGSSDPLITFPNIPAGTYSLSASYSGDTNWNAATYSDPQQLTFVAPATQLTATTTTLTLTPGSVDSTGNVTFSISVQETSSQNGPPDGVVNLYGNGASFGSVLLSSSSFTSLTATGSTTIAATAIPSGTIQVVAEYQGSPETASSISSPVPLTVTVTDFSLSVVGENLSLPAGQSVSIPVALGGAYSGSTTIALSCVTSSASIGCAINPASASLTGSGTASLTINAFTSASAASATTAVDSRNDRFPLRAKAGLVFAFLIFAALPRRKRLARLWVLLVLSAGLSLAAGCGGSSSSSQTTKSTVTPAPSGSYSVTITGVSAGITHSAKLNVQVQ